MDKEVVCPRGERAREGRRGEKGKVWERRGEIGKRGREPGSPLGRGYPGLPGSSPPLGPSPSPFWGRGPAGKGRDGNVDGRGRLGTTQGREWQVKGVLGVSWASTSPSHRPPARTGSGIFDEPVKEGTARGYLPRALRTDGRHESTTRCVLALRRQMPD
jgi:hypothetical protein